MKKVNKKKEIDMKKKYTKKQITEAIAHWKKMLNEDENVQSKKINEAMNYSIFTYLQEVKDDIKSMQDAFTDVENHCHRNYKQDKELDELLHILYMTMQSVAQAFEMN